jgi:hypothetical protein
MERREFITKSSRWFLFGGLLGISGFLAYRRRIGDPDNCFANPFCKGCGQFSSCDIVASSKPLQNEKKERK